MILLGMSGAPKHTHMAHTMRPFLRVLRDHPGLAHSHDGMPAPLAPGERGEAARTEALLRRTVETLGDEDLGLKAARAIEVGDFEVIEYTCSTAPNLRAALLALKRYFELVDQSIRVELDLEGATAQVAFISQVARSRPGTDFLVGGIFVVTERWLRPLPPDLEVCLRHPAPAELGEYATTFGDRPVHFDCAFDGVRFASRWLDTPLRTAEATVHALLRTRAEQLLSELDSVPDAWLARLRADLLAYVPSGDIGAAAVSKRLGVSGRTLSRRLTELGTTFSEQVQQLRKRTAEHYLTESGHSVEEIAFLLGYSEAPPFVRAFKRWTGVSPGEYRIRRRDRQPPGAAPG